MKKYPIYVLPYISDKNLFKAVCFSLTIMRQGESPRLANYKAAHYYEVNISDVAKYTGKIANNVKYLKNKGS